ncbi:transposase [Sphingobacterium sp. DR205]|nr:transposase [Sphingobacterium sp. DR205]QIH33626.1 transposase [Sphingobacterium sp. DR205]
MDHIYFSKKNEICAIPELRKLLDIDGSIINIDAMSTESYSRNHY